jgi:hypothetical protein
MAGEQLSGMGEPLPEMNEYFLKEECNIYIS